jgi:hypothetical protein
MALPKPASAGRSAGSASLIIAELPVGTRAAALSGACAAAVAEPAAVYWNPAGLASDPRTRIEALHVEQGQRVRVEHILYSQPMASGGALGAFGSYLGQPPIKETLEDASGGYLGTGRDLAVYQYMCGAGYGQDLSRLVMAPFLGTLWSRGSLGASLTVLGENIAGDRSMTAAVDAGYQYSDYNLGRTAGLVLRNLGGAVRGGPLPFTAQAGVAQRMGGVLVAFDVLTAADDVMRLRGGVEWTIETGAGSLALRGGAQHSISSELLARFSGGLGYRFRLQDKLEFGFDYAFIPVRYFEDVHAVSVQVSM